MGKYDLQDNIIECGHRIVQDGLVARTWGNISARIDEDSFYITPSGRAYDDLGPEDIVAVNIANLETIGPGKPSSEKGVHAAVYEVREDASFIIHTHQYFASALSVLKQDLLGDSFVKSQYGENGSSEINNNVREALLAHPDCDCILMSNHGALIFADSYEACYSKVMEFEMKCKDFYMQLLDDVQLIYQSPEELIDDDTIEKDYFPIVPVLDDMAQFGGCLINRFSSQEEALDKKNGLDELSQDGCIGYVDKEGFVYLAKEGEEDAMDLIIAKHQAAWLLTTEYDYDPIPEASIKHDRENYINYYSKLI